MIADEKSTKFFNDALVYGLISITIVSILPLGAAVIVPLLKSNSRQRFLSFFVAMAISTLSSDAFLHIIPQILGVHHHSHEHEPEHEHEHKHEHEHEHEHGHLGEGNHHHVHDHDDHKNHSVSEHDHGAPKWFEVTPDRQILLQLSTVLLSIYAIYFIEFVIFRRSKKHCSNMSKEECTEEHNNNNNNNLKTTTSSKNDSESGDERTDGGHELVKLERNCDSEETFCGLKARAFIILFGDGIHNLLDGIAVGSSFLISNQLGLITTIAVVCHELPHELGDMAVLIDSGLSICVALILNLLSALTAYVGLFIAILIGRNDGAENFLLSLTAGMFLYVAWVDMLSHLKDEDQKNYSWIKTCLIQFCGFFVGFLLIFLIGWFEHLLH